MSFHFIFDICQTLVLIWWRIIFQISCDSEYHGEERELKNKMTTCIWENEMPFICQRQYCCKWHALHLCKKILVRSFLILWKFSFWRKHHILVLIFFYKMEVLWVWVWAWFFPFLNIVILVLTHFKKFKMILWN